MERIRLLMDVFCLSLTDIANASGRTISRSQIHRILRGERKASAKERQSLAKSISALVSSRSDSAYLFQDEKEATCATSSE